MSSGKYQQKRIGYLGAVQSFRPDTEVLMLATNLIKKVCSTLFLDWGSQITNEKPSGPRLHCADHDSPTHHRSSSLYHTLTRSLDAIRPTTATHLEQPIYSEENDRHAVPTSTRLPRDAESSMAQNQRPSYVPRGRSQRDCCHRQCRLRAWMETAKRLSPPGTAVVRAPGGGWQQLDGY